MKNKTITAFLITAVFLSSPLVYAQSAAGDEPGWGEHQWKKGKHEMMDKYLNLTEDQKKQMQANRKSEMAQMKATMQAMRDKNKQLRQELAKDTPDMTKVSQIQEQLKALQGQMVDNRVNHTLAIKKILTPEQFKKFMEKREGQRKRMKEHMKHKMPGAEK